MNSRENKSLTPLWQHRWTIAITVVETLRRNKLTLIVKRKSRLLGLVLSVAWFCAEDVSLIKLYKEYLSREYPR